MNKLTKRNTIIDILRFVSSFLMICYHFYSYYSSKVSDSFENAYMCDEFFFIVTGYYLMNYADNNSIDIINYLKNRIKRIVLDTTMDY